MKRLANHTAQAGQYIIINPQGFIVRVQDHLTSWAAEAHLVLANGATTRVA